MALRLLYWQSTVVLKIEINNHKLRHYDQQNMLYTVIINQITKVWDKSVSTATIFMMNMRTRKSPTLPKALNSPKGKVKLKV